MKSLLAHRALLVVLLATTALHLILFAITRGGVLESDATAYDQLGWSIAKEKGLELWGHQTASRPPLYPLFVGAVYSIFGHNPDMVKLLQIVPALLTIVLTYAIGRDLYGDRVGLLAAAAVSFYPELVGLRLLLWAETLFAFTVTLSLWALIRLWRRPAWWRVVLLGLSIGVAGVTRSPGMSLAPAAILFLLLVRRSQSLRSWAHASLAVAALAALVVAPWVVRNWAVLGQPVVGDTFMGQALYTGHADYTPLISEWKTMDSFDRDPVMLSLKANGISMERDEIAWNNALYKVAVQNVVDRPLLFLARLPGKFLDMWGPERFVAAECREGALGQDCPPYTLAVAAVTNVAYAALMLAFLVALLRLPDSQPKWLAAIVIALYVSMFLLTYGAPRYRLPLVPLMAVLGSAVVVHRLRNRVPVELSRVT